MVGFQRRWEGKGKVGQPSRRNGAGMGSVQWRGEGEDYPRLTQPRCLWQLLPADYDEASERKAYRPVKWVDSA